MSGLRSFPSRRVLKGHSPARHKELDLALYEFSNVRVGGVNNPHIPATYAFRGRGPTIGSGGTSSQFEDDQQWFVAPNIVKPSSSLDLDDRRALLTVSSWLLFCVDGRRYLPNDRGNVDLL